MGAIIVQIHGAATHATTLILRICEGDLRYYLTDLVAANLCCRRVSVNVIHEVKDMGPGDLHFMCKVYTAPPNIRYYMESRWKDINILRILLLGQAIHGRGGYVASNQRAATFPAKPENTSTKSDRLLAAIMKQWIFNNGTKKREFKWKAMELELGLKITHTRDDITSFTNLQIVKDSSGPLFVSRETETMLVLVGYLKGYKREYIKIEINEDGDRIIIGGQQPIQEIVMVGWILQKNEVVLRAFRKAFRIPDGVILDKINAKFDDEDRTLTIIMPKLVRGIRGGVGIQEVQENQELDRETPVSAQTLSDNEMRNVMEDFEQALQKEKNRKEPDTTQALADEAAVEEQDKEGLKQERVKPRIEAEEEIKQLVEQVIEEPMIESNLGESKKMEDVPEKAEEMTQEAKHITENGRESEEAIPEKAAATPVAHPAIAAREPDEVQPEKETQKPQIKELSSADQTSKALPGLGEQQKEKIDENVHGLQINELTEEPQAEMPSKPSIQAEHEQINFKAGVEMHQESENRETDTNGQETIKPEPVQENEGATTGCSSVSNISRLFSPLLVAGSALLISLIVIVIKLIRHKRKTS